MKTMFDFKSRFVVLLCLVQGASALAASDLMSQCTKTTEINPVTHVINTILDCTNTITPLFKPETDDFTETVISESPVHKKHAGPTPAPTPRPDGELNYRYGRLYEFEDMHTPGADFLENLLKNSKLDVAIREDAPFKNLIENDHDVKRVFREEPNYQKIIDRGPSLKFLLTEPSGTGYTVGEHTTRVLNNYDAQKGFHDFSHVRWPQGFDSTKQDSFFKHLFAFHDISKSIAAATGDKSRHKEFNYPLIPALMKAAGFSETEAQVALALEDADDDIGSYLAGHATLQETIDDMGQHARSVKMDPADFFRIQELYYVCDAGAYGSLSRNVFRRTADTGEDVPRSLRFRVLQANLESDGHPRSHLSSGDRSGIVLEDLYGDENPRSPGAKFVKEMIASCEHCLADDRTLQGMLDHSAPLGDLLAKDPPLKAIFSRGPSLSFLLGQESRNGRSIGADAIMRVNRYRAIQRKFDLDQVRSPSGTIDYERLVETTLTLSDIGSPVSELAGDRDEHRFTPEARLGILRAMGFSDNALGLSEEMARNVDLAKFADEGDFRANPEELKHEKATLTDEAKRYGLGVEDYFRVLGAYSVASSPDHLEDSNRYRELYNFVLYNELPPPPPPKKGKSKEKEFSEPMTPGSPTDHPPVHPGGAAKAVSQPQKSTATTPASGNPAPTSLGRWFKSHFDTENSHRDSGIREDF